MDKVIRRDIILHINAADPLTMSTVVEDGVPSQCDNMYTRMIGRQNFAIIDLLQLESGSTIKDCPLAFRTFGKLNESRDNVIVISHALTGSADASDWWSPLFGKGNAVDHTRFFVFCANVLGSPYGSASSLTICAETGTRFGPNFPQTTVGDDVRAQKLVLDALGVKSIAAVIGGSMGGMAVLEWGIRMPLGYISTIIPIATAVKTSAWGVSWNEAQRNCILADSMYKAGWYEPTPDGQPCSGISAARMVAMLTYRSAHSFEQRFGREKYSPQQRVDSPQPAVDRTISQDNVMQNQHEPTFAAQSYLQHQGRKFVRRFDANCYLHLLRKLDNFDATSAVEQEGDPSDPREGSQRLAAIEALIIGVESDGLFLPYEQAQLAQCLPKARLHMLKSSDGHDGFLLEFQELNRVISKHLSNFCSKMFDADVLDATNDTCDGITVGGGVGEEW